jgi:sulfonate dioxygenase
MTSTTTTTTLEAITQHLPTLTLRPEGESAAAKPEEKPVQDDAYRYAHLLPVFVPASYPPLEPFEHADPGHRALTHANPRAFLDNATSVVDITPFLGTEVTGVSLAQLDADGRDELALEACPHDFGCTRC